MICKLCQKSDCSWDLWFWSRKFIYVLSNFCACRKIPRDLTEATLSGAGLSVVAALSMLFLFGMVRFQAHWTCWLWHSLAIVQVICEVIIAPMPFCSFSQELNNYLAVSTSTSIIVDRSADGDFLRIDFNIRYNSFHFVFSTQMSIIFSMRAN